MPRVTGTQTDRVRTAPGTAGQRLLWLMARHHGQQATLNAPLLFRLDGPVDVEALSLALTMLTDRHEALRTTVHGRGREMVQQVHAPRPVAAELRTAGSAEELEPEVLEVLRAGLDIEQWPVRPVLISAGQEHALCVNISHFVTDGWSGGILARELWTAYAQALGDPAEQAGQTGQTGQTSHFKPVRWQYADFAEWQAAAVDGEAWRAHEGFWRERLADVEYPSLSAPPRPGAAVRTGAEQFVFADRDVAAFKELAREERASLFCVVLAAFYAWLYQETNTTDLAVGSLFGNRRRPETRNTVGFLANLLVLRTAVPAAGTFRDLVRATRLTVGEALVHQDVPCQMVGRVGAAARGRPEDVVFQMLAEPRFDRRAPGGLRIRQLPRPDGLAPRFAFEMVISPVSGGPAEGLEGTVLFAQDRFDRAWVRSALARFRAVTTEHAAEPDRRL